MQVLLTVDSLPDSGIAASAEFFGKHLEHVKAKLADEGTTALAIVMPAADSAHDDWRQSLAADLAREYAPKRVNIVGAANESAARGIIEYLEDAPGVTGQYCPAHE